ncbi:MAG: iron-containing alcohol dehydrogenase [Anaerolineales bacterium]
MRFEFATAERIIFGPGTLREVAPLAAEMGHKVLVVTGSSPGRASSLVDALVAHGIKTEGFIVAYEPTTETVREGTDLARRTGCDLVIAYGGGSVIDAGKAIAALLTNGGVPLDYLEVIGRGQPLTEPPAPMIAIPTTAGTGAEVTRNAVLASPEHRVKVSLRSPLMLPTLAVVDPVLTHSVPPEVTASTGLDAFTQVLEPYISHQANPLTDGFCREGLARASTALRQAYRQGKDAEAREEMALVSLLGGLALANAKLGAVHGFAGVLGGMYDAPHGVICGRLLPYVMAANVRALREREPDSPALERYEEIAIILTGDFDAGVRKGVAWVEALCEDLKVPGLASYGVERTHFPEIIEKARNSSSMKGNPIRLTDTELRRILEQAL